MKQKRKKFVVGLLSIVTLGAISIFPTVSNAESEIISSEIEVSGLTEEYQLPEALTFDEPTIGITRGYNYPTKKWDGKQYKIPQTAIGNGNYVYTNVYFSGKSSYEYYFHNTGNTTIEIQLKNISSHALYKRITLKPGKNVQAKLSTKGNWYAQFKGGNDYVFKGWVK